MKGLSYEEKLIISANKERFTQEFFDQILFDAIHEEVEAKHESVDIEIGIINFSQ